MWGFVSAFCRAARQTTAIFPRCSPPCMRMLQPFIIGHRSAVWAEAPATVSWRPQGVVLQTLVGLGLGDRERLIVEQACLSQHCDWPVDPVGYAPGHHFWRYFSSVQAVHDPRNGVPDPATSPWWPALAIQPGVMEGDSCRHTAYKALFKRAHGMCFAASGADSSIVTCCAQMYVGLGCPGACGMPLLSAVHVGTIFEFRIGLLMSHCRVVRSTGCHVHQAECIWKYPHDAACSGGHGESVVCL